jgi:UDP-2,3-diacylglucosamine pyrophosphatase LpxH
MFIMKGANNERVMVLTLENRNNDWSGRDIFVISDLHIGDGSAKDNLGKGSHQLLMMRLLDKIETAGARLVILGDLFELWRYRPEAVVQRWVQLLDRLHRMDVIYVPGNHDWQFWRDREYWQRQHPFFTSLQKPFTVSIGTKHFKFMHGHEIDPVTPGFFEELRPLLRIMTSTLEFRSDMCLVTSDAMTDALQEAGEQVLYLWQRLTRQFNRAIHEHLGFTDDGWRRMIRPIRTRNMIARFYRQQQQGLYDVTITGHTHKAGRFGNWYFNCGSWTQSMGQYLHINPDGQVVVNDWTLEGNKINQTIVL